MVCVKCRRDYGHKTSTARDAVDFCSAECELEYKFPIMCRAADTAAEKPLVISSLIRTA